MKVLIVTGGLVSGVEPSVLSSLRKLFQQWRASEHAWLDEDRWSPASFDPRPARRVTICGRLI
jgi:hypothetical protein